MKIYSLFERKPENIQSMIRDFEIQVMEKVDAFSDIHDDESDFEEVICENMKSNNAVDIIKTITKNFKHVHAAVISELRDGQDLDLDTYKTLSRFHEGQEMIVDRFEKDICSSLDLSNSKKAKLLDGIEHSRLRLGSVIQSLDM